MENPRIRTKTQNTHDSNTKHTFLLFSLFFFLFFLFFLFFSLFSTVCPSQNETKMNCLFDSTPFYSLIFPLIKIRSSISQHLHNNFCYFHNGLSSSQIMVFISFLTNYNFTLVLVHNSRFNKFIISQFDSEQQLPKYYNGTWCTYGPLQLHIPYTLSGRGVTVTTEIIFVMTEIVLLLVVNSDCYVMT